MLVRRVELTDVRSYDRARLDLSSGVSVLVGRNGSGKTNLLESLHRVATGGSHRSAGDAPLIRNGSDRGAIRVRVETDEGRTRSVEVELAHTRKPRIRVDGHEVRRAPDAVGVLRAVLFAPEDIAVVRGDPRERRRFLDELLSLRRPAYAVALADYRRVIAQRNNLLKQARSLTGRARSAAATTLEAWTEQLVGHGAALLSARLASVTALAAPAERIYAGITDRPDGVGLSYVATALDARVIAAAGTPSRADLERAMRQALVSVADEEVHRGATLVGPHRDDLDLTVAGLPARSHASHGEAWSLALALRLASIDVLSDVGDRPVVLLDDVFAELDSTRRDRLAAACAGFDQVIVTAAVDADVPLAGPRVEVRRDDAVTRLHPRPVAADGAA